MLAEKYIQELMLHCTRIVARLRNFLFTLRRTPPIRCDFLSQKAARMEPASTRDGGEITTMSMPWLHPNSTRTHTTSSFFYAGSLMCSTNQSFQRPYSREFYELVIPPAPWTFHVVQQNHISPMLCHLVNENSHHSINTRNLWSHSHWVTRWLLSQILEIRWRYPYILFF